MIGDILVSQFIQSQMTFMSHYVNHCSAYLWARESFWAVLDLAFFQYIYQYLCYEDAPRNCT